MPEKRNDVELWDHVQDPRTGELWASLNPPAQKAIIQTVEDGGHIAIITVNDEGNFVLRTIPDTIQV
jgi:hypothetical protein